MTKLRAGLLGAVLTGAAFYCVALFQHAPKLAPNPDLVEVPLPTALSIHGEAWKVVPTGMVESGLLGETFCESHVIVVQGAQPAPDSAEVIVHEGLHALTCLGGDDVHNWLYNNGASDHKGIHWAAPEVVDLLVENPQLYEYVRRYGRKLSPIEAMNAGGPGGDPPPQASAAVAVVGHDKGSKE